MPLSSSGGRFCLLGSWASFNHSRESHIHLSLSSGRIVSSAFRAQASACWERYAKDESRARAGRVEVGFVVTANGRPRAVRVVDNTTGNEALAACLAQRLNDRPAKSEQFRRGQELLFAGLYRRCKLIRQN